MKKQITKALAIALSATLFIQPITALAVEEAPAPEVEVRVETPAPAPEEAPAEENVCLSDVDQKVEAAITAVEDALPPKEVEQERTDAHLYAADADLKKIDGDVDALDKLNAAAEEQKAEYAEALDDYQQDINDIREGSAAVLSWDTPFGPVPGKGLVIDALTDVAAGKAKAGTRLFLT